MYPDSGDRPRIPETVDEWLGIPEPVLTLEQLAKQAGFDAIPNPWLTPTARTAEPVRDSGGDLNKFLNSSSERRRASLAGFIRLQMALGASLESLVKHAEKFDKVTANEIREIGAQIGA
jgi:hypothetical protein